MSTNTSTSTSTTTSSTPTTTNTAVDERRKKYKAVFDAMDEYDFRQALRLLERKDIASLPFSKVSIIN